MYEFRDINEALEGDILPSEALQINGEYIENLISGYRTLNVTGREALSPDVVSYTTGIRDGSKLKSRRFPERIITVTYQLTAETNEAFREAYNKLAAILNVEDAELIFNDEQDKYFTGTPCIIGAVKPGTNSVIGEFEILCVDPFKYSVLEYEATPLQEESTILIDYNGTYKAYPTLEANFYSEDEVGEDGETANALTGAGDCGFVAFFNDKEKIIQLGDPDEADTVTAYKPSQTLVNQKFLASAAWGSASQALWVKNNDGIDSSVVHEGSLHMVVATYTNVAADSRIATGTALTATSNADAPPFNYKITYKTERTSTTSVKIVFSITAALGRDSAYFGRGYGLQGALWVGDRWRTIKIKDTSEYWKGKSAHSFTITHTMNNLAEDAVGLKGFTFRVTRTDTTGGKAGILAETALKQINVSKYTTRVAETYYLKPASYGSESGKWHGPCITRTLPADDAGEIGATNFTLTYKQRMCIGSADGDTKQKGAFHIRLIDTDGKSFCSFRIVKSATGKKATLYHYLNGEQVNKYTIDLSYKNKYFGVGESAAQTSTIKKSGSTISINTGGVTLKATSSTLADVKVAKISFSFEQWSTDPSLSSNGLYWVKFVKHNCETQNDIPNKFGADDVLVADCKNGEVLLNGLAAPELGALGNDWEEFFLTPGVNQIGITYSNWLSDETAPKMKVRYREVFL